MKVSRPAVDDSVSIVESSGLAAKAPTPAVESAEATMAHVVPITESSRAVLERVTAQTEVPRRRRDPACRRRAADHGTSDEAAHWADETARAGQREDEAHADRACQTVGFS